MARGIMFMLLDHNRWLFHIILSRIIDCLYSWFLKRNFQWSFLPGHLMARIKPQALLIQSKKKKSPTRISLLTIIICNLVVILVVLSLYGTYKHWHRRLAFITCHMDKLFLFLIYMIIGHFSRYASFLYFCNFSLFTEYLLHTWR